MEQKRFKMIDEAFTCTVCGCHVEPLRVSARDHCPNCLSSLHVDINPGDRASTCKGVLEPIDIEKKGDALKIVYRCNKCGMIHKNKVAPDDNYDAILKIMSKYVYESKMKEHPKKR